MLIHGEDSLNENTEREGLGRPDSRGSDLNTLRMRLGKRSDEPTRQQLIATGELDPEEGDSEGNGEGEEELDGTGVSTEDENAFFDGAGRGGHGSTAGDGRHGSTAGDGGNGGGSHSTGLTIPKTGLSIRKQIEQGILAGKTKEELIEEGFNRRSVQTVASELKTKMGTSRSTAGRQPAKSSGGLTIFAKGSPPEAIIDSIAVPDVADGNGYAFEQGIKFGMSLLTISIRMVQEMSAIGVQQSKPIIDMAKSMREGEALAAKNAAGEAATEAAVMVQDSLMPVLANMQKNMGGGGGEGVDPMRAMMVRTMEPMFNKMLNGMMTRLPGMGGGTQEKLPAGASQPQLTAGISKIEGWEVEEKQL